MCVCLPEHCCLIGHISCYVIDCCLLWSSPGFGLQLKDRNYYSPERRAQLCVCKCVAVNLIIMFEGLNWRV